MNTSDSTHVSADAQDLESASSPDPVRPVVGLTGNPNPVRPLRQLASSETDRPVAAAPAVASSRPTVGADGSRVKEANQSSLSEIIAEAVRSRAPAVIVVQSELDAEEARRVVRGHVPAISVQVDKGQDVRALWRQVRGRR
jgi:hypothetical protein